MINLYKKNYCSKNVQFILTDLGGRVVESDQTLFKISSDIHIYDFHPFFSWIPRLDDTRHEPLLFSCIHLEVNDFKFITDIEVSQDVDYILIMVHNLTDHYNAYQTASQVKNEFLIKSELAVLKNVQLVEQEKFKNQFIGNLSHELRNPLTSIIAIANVVGKTKLENHQQQMIDFLKECTENLKELLDDILNINKMATGNLLLKKKLFSLKKLLDLLAFTYSAKATEKKLKFNIAIDEKIPEFVEGDRLRLFQILTNLLDNAIRYSNSGTIVLEIQLNQKRAGKVNLRFSVKDDGIGIPEDKVDTIFESFSQIDTSVEEKKGSGLGLSIVKGLVELMKGKIKVRANPNVGSTFYFDVSLKYPLLGKLNNSKEHVQNQKAYNTNKKYKVLLVEDDAVIQMVMFKILTDTGCFYIDLLKDGSEVLETLVKNQYDLILMDVNLGNTSGDEIVKNIRKLPIQNIRTIPIIGVTGNAFASDLTQYKKAGMNTIVVKPFNPEEFLQTVFKYLKN